VLQIRDVYPGSEFFHSGFRILGRKDPGSATKEFMYTEPKKCVRKLQKYDFFPFGSGSRGQKCTGSRIRNNSKRDGPEETVHVVDPLALHNTRFASGYSTVPYVVPTTYVLYLTWQILRQFTVNDKVASFLKLNILCSMPRFYNLRQSTVPFLLLYKLEQKF